VAYIPDGYAEPEADPYLPGDDGDNDEPVDVSPALGRAVTHDEGPRRLFASSGLREGPSAAVVARCWARCAHPALVPVVDLGHGRDGSWFATPGVGPAGELTLEELAEVLEAVGLLHADDRHHGRIGASLVRTEEGLRLLPPWGPTGESDHRALARLVARAVAGAEASDRLGAVDSVTLTVAAPQVVGEAIAALWEGRCLVVDALVAMRECTDEAEAGTEVALTPLRPGVCIVPPDPPPDIVARPAGPATLRARGVLLAPRDEAAVQALWGSIREVSTSGRPRGVVVRGAESALDGLSAWLQRTLLSWGLARTIDLGRGDDEALVAALHPGGDRAEEVQGRWLDAAGRSLAESRADAQRIRRWCGPVASDEQRASAAVGRWELQRRIDEASGRGLFVVILSEPNPAGMRLARDLARGDGPVLVVLILPDRPEHGSDERLQAQLSELAWAGVEVAAPPTALGDWVGDDEVLGSIAEVEDARSPREQLRWLEAHLDGGSERPVSASDALDALAVASGHRHRVRDALHLASLSPRPAPAAVLDGFLGPVGGLWDTTRLARRDGSRVWVEPELAAEARARSDARYLHRRLARAWGRSTRAGHAQHAAAHSLEAGETADARAWLEAAGTEAWSARAPARLDTVADLWGRLGSPADAWQQALAEARAAQLRGTESAEHWQAVAEAADGQEEAGAARAEAALGQARIACAAIDTDASTDTDADALLQAAIDLAAEGGCIGLEGEGLALSAARADRGEGDEALSLFAKALHRLERGGRRWLAARTLVVQAEGRARRGQLAEARELYEDAAEAYLEVDDGPAAVQARLGAATCYLQVDELDDALAIANQAQVDARAWLDPEGMVRAAAVRARVERHAGSVDAAAARYDRVVRDASELGLDDVLVEAELGRSLMALARGDQHRAYECTTAAATALEALPGHPLWARYRLAVAGQLAKRGDHMQTWQWLWSAKELGLDDADRDVAELANQILAVARLEGWGNVIRVSAAVAVEQLRRLGAEGEADRLKTDITGFITR